MQANGSSNHDEVHRAAGQQRSVQGLADSSAAAPCCLGPWGCCLANGATGSKGKTPQGAPLRCSPDPGSPVCCPPPPRTPMTHPSSPPPCRAAEGLTQAALLEGSVRAEQQCWRRVSTAASNQQVPGVAWSVALTSSQSDSLHCLHVAARLGPHRTCNGGAWLQYEALTAGI
ncbi:hypothetical protein V8C86DRAFT_3031430 [Haematococcus lacustris]